MLEVNNTPHWWHFRDFHSLQLQSSELSFLSEVGPDFMPGLKSG